MDFHSMDRESVRKLSLVRAFAEGTQLARNRARGHGGRAGQPDMVHTVLAQVLGGELQVRRDHASHAQAALRSPGQHRVVQLKVLALAGGAAAAVGDVQSRPFGQLGQRQAQIRVAGARAESAGSLRRARPDR